MDRWGFGARCALRIHSDHTSNPCGLGCVRATMTTMIAPAIDRFGLRI
jgi:hypothetical protein